MKKAYQFNREKGDRRKRLLEFSLLALCVIAAYSVYARGQSVGARAGGSSPERITSRRERAARKTVINLAALARQEAGPHVLAGEREEEIEPPETQAANIVPADAAISFEKPRASSSQLQNDALASPLASASFQATEDNGDIPPDTHGAAGLQHLMTVNNGRVRIQDKAGNIISSVVLATFWRSLSSAGLDVFDPKVVYDSLRDRWIVISCAERASAGSSVLVGVSQSSDPMANWSLYRIDADESNLLWADYPSLGFNKDWIAVQVNMYPVGGGSGATAAKVFVLDKADFYAGGQGLYTALSLSGVGQTQVPALTYDPALPVLYLLQDYNGNSGGNGYLRLYTITGAVGSERISLTTPLLFATPNPWASASNGSLDFAPQQGSAQKIQTGDSRMQTVAYRNGSLWCAQTVFLPAGNSPTRSAIQWWELSPTGQIKQRGRIEDPTGSTFYAFPSLAVNKLNDLLVGYTRFSPGQYPTAAYSFRAAADASGSMREDALLKSGEASYYKTYNSGKNRWGDYSNTVVDPANDTDLWTIQEYSATPLSPCAANCDRWATWWGRIAPAAAEASNQIDDARFFVGQHYRDFLNRQPDAGGLDYWMSQINSCADAACVNRERVNVSAAFFVENEFQRTGSFVYRFYTATYGERPTFQQFTADRALVPEGPQLEASKQAFAAAWVERPSFLRKYPQSLTGPQFIAALLETVRTASGADLSGASAALVADYEANQSRARVVRLVADNELFVQAEYNRAFVLMQYFGYLQRDADDGGYQFWLDVLNNRVPGNYRAMVCAFLTSTEYQQRFGPVITRTNNDCGP